AGIRGRVGRQRPVVLGRIVEDVLRFVIVLAVVHHRDRRNRRRRGGRGRVRRNLTGPHRVDVNPGRAAGGKVVVVLARHGTGHEAAGRIGDVVTATARTRTGARDEGRRRVHHQHRTAITVDVVLQGDVTRGSHVT